MNPGSVFYHSEFTFHDGETGQKLFVALGNTGQTHVVVKTTSQRHGRGLVAGCQSSDRFPNAYIPDRSCDLNGETWICLDEFYEFETRELLRLSFSGVIKPVCNFTQTMTRMVQDCASQSEDISLAQRSAIQACLV